MCSPQCNYDASYLRDKRIRCGKTVSNYDRNYIRSMPMDVDVEAWLMPNGDELRIVSQYTLQDFSDKYRSEFSL